MRQRPVARFALAALLAGAVGIAFAPIFVRWSETGPSATAFYRLFLALPFLGIWASLEKRPPGAGQTSSDPASTAPVDRSRKWYWLALPGLLFAGDLALWHWSIKLTSVANATLLANVAPIVVTVAARVLFQERITLVFLAGMALALTGAAMVMGHSLTLADRHLTGDLLGLGTALFYGGYMLSVKHARRRHSTAKVMVWSSFSACPVLLGVAALSGERLWPTHPTGWSVLIALALVSQVGGQGLIAYALAHLRASFSSVSLLLQPAVAAMLAWMILQEPLSPLQASGGLVILAGIAVASRANR